MAFVLLSLIAVAQKSAFSREEVESFDSKITVRKDATLLVREKIDVRALGINIQHGIYREFVSRDGRPSLQVNVTDAQLDGQPVPFKVKDENGTRRIYLGDPSTPLVTGEHDFTLTYETSPVVTEQNGRDRLYWNVTGDSWDFPITSISARVELPEGVPQDALTVEGYTGPYGATGKDYMFDLDRQGAVTFTAGPLAAKEGLTISVGFPGGYIHHGWNVPLLLLDNAGLAAGVVGLFVLLLYWSVSWFFFGKDPAPGPVMARTEPPNDVSPAGVRYLTQMSVDNKALTIAIVSLARAGILTVEETAGDYVLTRTHADFHELPSEERALAKALFGGGHTVSLKMNARRVRKAVDAFRKALEKRYGKQFAANSRFAVPAFIIGGLAILTSLYFQLGPHLKQDGPTALAVLLFAAGSGILLHRSWPHSLRDWKGLLKTAKSDAGFTAERRTLLIMVGLGIVLVISWVTLAMSLGWAWAALLLLYAGINIGFAHIMKAPTPQGRRMLDEIAGFRIHLRKLSAAVASSAEDDEQALANFEPYLAYAMALDMETGWGRRLDTAVQQGVENAARFIPHWYRGENFDRFVLRPGYFGAAAASAAAASYGHGAGGGYGSGSSGSGSGGSGGFSGGSGGGFSGGGAGAGGGGGW
jgi:uncharacterized membrane protein